MLNQTIKQDVMEIIEEAFRNDTFERELRLTEEQVNILKKEYPRIKIELLEDSYQTEKKWYKVCII